MFQSWSNSFAINDTLVCVWGEIIRGIAVFKSAIDALSLVVSGVWNFSLPLACDQIYVFLFVKPHLSTSTNKIDHFGWSKSPLWSAGWCVDPHESLFKVRIEYWKGKQSVMLATLWSYVELPSGKSGLWCPQFSWLHAALHKPQCAGTLGYTLEIPSLKIKSETSTSPLENASTCIDVLWFPTKYTKTFTICKFLHVIDQL